MIYLERYITTLERKNGHICKIEARGSDLSLRVRCAQPEQQQGTPCRLCLARKGFMTILLLTNHKI